MYTFFQPKIEQTVCSFNFLMWPYKVSYNQIVTLDYLIIYYCKLIYNLPWKTKHIFIRKNNSRKYDGIHSFKHTKYPHIFFLFNIH